MKGRNGHMRGATRLIRTADHFDGITVRPDHMIGLPGSSAPLYMDSFHQPLPFCTGNRRSMRPFTAIQFNHEKEKDSTAYFVCTLRML